MDRRGGGGGGGGGGGALRGLSVVLGREPWQAGLLRRVSVAPGRGGRRGARPGNPDGEDPALGPGEGEGAVTLEVDRGHLEAEGEVGARREGGGGGLRGGGGVQVGGVVVGRVEVVLRTKEAAELTVKEVQDGGAAAGVVGGDGGHGHGVGEEQVHGHGVDGAGVGRRLGKFHLCVVM